MKKLTENEKELLDMLDDIFDFENDEEAYYQILLIRKEIEITLLKMMVDDLIAKKTESLINMGVSLN